MITKDKAYRTKKGENVRIYATDGSNEQEYPVHGAILKRHGWFSTTWTSGGQHSRLCAGDFDLVEADPCGILPRHRELLAEAYEGVGHLNANEATGKPFDQLVSWTQAALIALAKLDLEKSA